MIRGKQEDTVGSVEDRQVIQEEEEGNEQEEEEGMKTENMEGNESNKNMSSGAIGAISGTSTQK
jgi:hypothetical protein